MAEALRLSRELGLSQAAAAILVRRGFADPAAARAFLAADARSAPGSLPGIDAACETILDHVDRGTPITVFGDYDVDGVCSTAIAVRALRGLGSSPRWRLPSRAEGYGLSIAAVEELAAAGTSLLIAVDCGVTATAEVARARELGLDVVVADHHRPGDELPPCPIVHPALADPDAGVPALADFCAAGVVHKLALELHARAGREADEHALDLDLAGLATVCDMVPLEGENRRLAREGMRALARSTKPGVRALMRVAGIEPGELDATAAGFRLGPRINAAGRLGRADAALELLLTEDDERAEEVAVELDRLNMDRRDTERRILNEAEAQCAAQLHRGAIVVAGEGWHHGVVGIVASRLVERHNRPCVAIAIEEGVGRGSARSITGFDVHAGIAAGGSHLRRFGGHTMAAGLECDAELIPAFAAALADHADALLAPEDLQRVQRVDAVVSAAALDLGLAEDLQRLGPFGAANPAPKLLVPGAGIEHVTAMGEDGAHARFSLTSGSTRARGVAFRTSQRALADAGASPCDVAVDLERNHFNGAVEARVLLRGHWPSAPGSVHDVGGASFWEDFVTQIGSADAFPSIDAEGPVTTTVVDRRAEGFVGVCGDLVTSGQTVLVAVAHVGRRREALEAVVAGLAPGGLAVVGWEDLFAQPEVARPFDHLVALDPPPVGRPEHLLARLEGEGTAHLVWGEPERDFALACARWELELRAPLAEVFRALREERELGDERLGEVLRGRGGHPRGARECARLTRTLIELGLASAPGGRRLRLQSTEPTELDRSETYRACAGRLEALQRAWAPPQPQAAAAPSPA